MAQALPAIMIASTVASAGLSIAGGIQQSKDIKRQAEYNAKIYEQQAAMIEEKKKIQDIQFHRQAAFQRGKIIAQAGGKGLTLSGSPLAILIDNESQMLFDKAIEDYNLNIEKNYALSGAQYQRNTGTAQARAAKFSGYTNAFSTLLNGAGSFQRTFRGGAP